MKLAENEVKLFRLILAITMNFLDAAKLNYI